MASLETSVVIEKYDFVCVHIERKGHLFLSPMTSNSAIIIWLLMVITVGAQHLSLSLSSSSSTTTASCSFQLTIRIIKWIGNGIDDESTNKTNTHLI